MTKEPQYSIFVEEFKKDKGYTLGPMASYMAKYDPKMMAIKLSRYKFVAKMLSGKEKVLEIGCGDGFGSNIVNAEVKSLLCTDFDEIWIDYCNKLCDQSIEFKVLDILHDVIDEQFDAIYAMDVFEHIEAKDENKFLKNIVCSLSPNGVLILGIPSLESQAYTSDINKEGHVNCKGGDEFKQLLEKYFSNVFMFSANDEIVHTGYFKMAHYLIAVCCGQKVSVK